MPSLPASDWQFWVVTLVALAGVVALVRPFLPYRSRTSPACPHCPSGGETCGKAVGVSGAGGEKVVRLGRG